MFVLNMEHSNVRTYFFVMEVMITQWLMNLIKLVFTALYYAILQQNEPMIELLVQNGAELTSSFKPSEIGMHLCNCVKNNQVDRLKAWHKAGADLDQADYDGRTPLLLVNDSFDLIIKTFFLGCKLQFC